MDDTTTIAHEDHTQLTVDIVSAYVSNNPVRATDLPALITQVHAKLVGLSTSIAEPEEVIEKATPYQIKKSITPDALISFIDGKAYKTLRRHLSTHSLDPMSYRARYGLPGDYPMVSPNYSAARSALAKNIGLGQLRRNGAQKTVEPAAQAPRRSGRRKAAETAAAE